MAGSEAGMADAPKNAAGYSLDVCEWNPDRDRAAQLSGDAFHGWAVWSVETPEITWHLCESCAGLPRFKRFRRRVWIGPKRESEDGN